MTPLGRYASPVAAILAIGLIGAYAIGILFGLPGSDTLQPLALLAAGVVFGGNAVANGWKVPLEAVHARLDAAGVPAAAARPEENTNP